MAPGLLLHVQLYAHFYIFSTSVVWVNIRVAKYLLIFGSKRGAYNPKTVLRAEVIEPDAGIYFSTGFLLDLNSANVSKYTII